MKRFILFLMILNTTQVLAQNFYVPATLNMPLLSTEGEFKGVVNLYGSGIQASIALKDNLVLFGNYSFATDNNSPLENYLADIGAGYRENIGPDVRFEVLGGIGYGLANSQSYAYGGFTKGDSSWQPNIDDFGNYHWGWAYQYDDVQITYSLSGSYLKMFVQPSIGFSVLNDHLELGVGLRLNQVFYNDLIYTITNSDETSGKILFARKINNIPNGEPTIEPGLRMALGFKKVKLNASYVWSFRGGQNVYGNFSAGILVDLFTLKHS